MASNESSVPTAEELVSVVSDFRQRGNHEFSNGRCDEAVAFYTVALQHCSSIGDNDHDDDGGGDDDDYDGGGDDDDDDGNVQQQMKVNDDSNDPFLLKLREEKILNLCNRSACYSQQEEWELGRNDAAQAWKLSHQSSVKAAYRYAKCSIQLREYDTAKIILQAALRILDDQEITASSQQQPPPPTPPTTIDNADDTNSPEESSPLPQPTIASNTASVEIAKQRTALQELWKQTLSLALKHETQPDVPETSIKFAKRPISIKEFQLNRQLGHGNFSEIYMVTHKVTNEVFALKKIEKKQAADLYKRQHPNVYNEIQMERRVLLEKLGHPGHPYVVRMYHAFQDYNNLYYLMDLHVERTDLWSQLRYKNLPGYGDTKANAGEKLVMMGCHRSTACLWLYELIGALEYIHSRGIVHRDLKTENILLSSTGHIVVIDFGTAKDLLQTDLNGPEFVGTPDFMSPEAVTGTDQTGDSSIGQYALLTDNEAKKVVEAGVEADLWALGAIAFILQTGHTPYWSPSPYLAFLKIKRALQYQNLLRPMGIINDECWDLITQLMKGKPSERIGAGAFKVDRIRGRVMRCEDGGYNVIRQHPYFKTVHAEIQNSSREKVKSKTVPIPSLQDLCYRACAEMVYRDSKDYEICDQHPPGDGSKHDLLRLEARERAAVMHCLDRRRLLSDPRVYGRFYKDVVAARLDKIRLPSRDFVGLTQMNDDQGKPPKAQMHDQYAKPIDNDPIKIVHLTNPYFSPSDAAIDENTRKGWIKQLKKCIVSINRNRPKLVVVTGEIDDVARKIISKISETIPTVIHDGTSFFTFWRMGVQCIALSTAKEQSDIQVSWLKQQLEQVRLSKYPLFVFVATDPSELPPFVLKKLAHGRTLCIFGITKWNPARPSSMSDFTVMYQANEMVDDASIRSTDSTEDDKDNFTTKVKATSCSGLYWITVDEEPDMWTADFEAIEA
jgi:3-phosphoinositide dependent protein kinase-1